MTENEVTVETDDGSARVFLVNPDGGGPPESSNDRFHKNAYGGGRARSENTVPWPCTFGGIC